MCRFNKILSFTRTGQIGACFLLMLSLFVFQGCANRSIESSFHGFRYDIVGEHYLMLQEYEKGYDFFRTAVQEHPDNAEACYFTGRFLLATKKSKQALVYFKKAVHLMPEEPEYHFWQGVAYGELKNLSKERKSYQQALKVDKDHLQALIYLGNNRLRSKHYQKSLELYRRALVIWPYSPTALYNRALASKSLRRTPEEKTAWLEYLRYYPSGGMARRAVSNLNRLGDFSYRIQRLGARSFALPKIDFQPLAPTLSKTSHRALDMVGAIAANIKKGTLHVVVYQKKNTVLARDRARSVKKYLSRKFPELRGRKVRLSWFPTSEKIKIKGRSFTIDESVRFILTDT